MKKSSTKGAMRLVAHRGDAKTLLAFDLTTPASRQQLAGFTVRITPPGKPAYFMFNSLRFEKPGDHAQDLSEPPTSTINAPIHKFRWVHVPGSFHQGLAPAWGEYQYEVTPRYFDGQKHLLPLDPGLTAKVKIEVAPFQKGKLTIGFTRGFTQSQAFTNNFGKDAKIKPNNAPILFDTSKICGTNAKGVKHTFEELYTWSGFTARKLINDCLDEVLNGGANISVDIFAYDLNEPGVVDRLIKLAAAGKARVLLDNAALHHASDNSKPEDEVEQMFTAAATGAAAIKRGKFGRYAHDKVFIVKKAGKAIKVLTGSTNFSVTGHYVNSNHVLVYDDKDVAGCFADVFDFAWQTDAKAVPFRASALSQNPFVFQGAQLPKTTIRFSPHREADARQALKVITDRVDGERNNIDGLGNVLFAVMELKSTAEKPVYDCLNSIHKDDSVFSFGISDNPEGIELYRIGKKRGVLVTGKPAKARLPPPFNQVRNLGFGHQIHHKFVVCDINGDNPTVFCGSSNLALGGEEDNGDNLLMIEDEDVTMVFAIEALGLIDHFNFLNRVATAPQGQPGGAPPAVPTDAAAAAEWFLGTTDFWARKFFDANDLHSKDRQIFAR